MLIPHRTDAMIPVTDISPLQHCCSMRSPDPFSTTICAPVQMRLDRIGIGRIGLVSLGYVRARFGRIGWVS